MTDNNLIIQSLRRVVSKNARNVFICESANGKHYTYGDFLSSAARVCRILRERGVKSGDAICALLPNGFDLATLYFAALFGQFVIAPIDLRKGEAAIDEIISHVKPKLLLSEGVGRHTVPVLTLTDLRAEITSPIDAIFNVEEFHNNIDVTRPYLISFTSGTTGVSKGVVHSFGNLFTSARAFADKFQFNAGHVFYHNLPMSYMAGILNLLILPFVSGSQVVLGPMFNVREAMTFWDLPIRHKVNAFWFTPTIVSFLLQIDRGEAGKTFGRKNQIIGCIGTAPLSPKHRELFEAKYQIPLYESYGLTETLFIATQKPKAARDDGGVGELLTGVEIHFGSDREIILRAPWQFQQHALNGSIQDYSASEYPSGDLGEITPQGTLRITGRKKDIVIKGGVNIVPAQLEKFIEKENMFVECVVLGVPDDLLGEKLVCFFVPPTNGVTAEQLKELNRKITRDIDVQSIIDIFEEVSELPRNLNGKIDKLRLKALFTERRRA